MDILDEVVKIGSTYKKKNIILDISNLMSDAKEVTCEITNPSES